MDLRKIPRALVGAWLLSFVAFLSAPFYPTYFYTVWFVVGWALAAPVVAVVAVFWKDASLYRLLLFVIASFLVATLTWLPIRYGVISPIPGVIPVYAYRTSLYLLTLGLAYLPVYHFRLFDRDGPVGHRLGLA